jgi:hypothetical protein
MSGIVGMVKLVYGGTLTITQAIDAEGKNDNSGVMGTNKT